MATTRKTPGAAMPRPSPPHQYIGGGGSQLLLGRTYGRRVWFDSARALEIFTDLSRRYERRIGIYHGLAEVQPQHLYFPEELRSLAYPREFANFCLFTAMSQRGGLNSDDSIRFMGYAWTRARHLFAVGTVADANAADVVATLQKLAEEFYSGGSNGIRRAGSLSFKVEEFAAHWVLNARALRDHWRGDIRLIFENVKDFEDAFARADSKRRGNHGGFHGMRRKIFSLLVFWLIEFGLIDQFHIPLIVDFHVLRALLQLGILNVSWQPLGKGDPKIEARRRPRALWKYPSIHIGETLVNEVIFWSYGFLKENNLSPFHVHNALWNLSRVLCAQYYGNKSFSVARKDKNQGKRYGITARLVDAEALARGVGWPKGYRDHCRYCPFEERFCRIAIPAGPYYDWGKLLVAGRHVIYTYRNEVLPGVILPEDEKIHLTRRQKNFAVVEPRGEASETQVPNAPTEQLPLVRKHRKKSRVRR